MWSRARNGSIVPSSNFHLGYSRVAAYMECPAKFFHTYIEGRRGTPSVPQRRGTAYHSVTEGLRNYVINRGTLYPWDKTERFARKCADEQNLTDRECENVVTASQFFHTYVYPKQNPFKVEHSFSITRRGIPITGRIDTIDLPEPTVAIVEDDKFSHEVWEDERAEHGIQPMVYQWAWEEDFKNTGIAYGGFAYNIIKVYPSPVFQKITIDPMTPEQSVWWEEQLVQIANGIRAGVFPARTSARCKRCDHRKICRPVIYSVHSNLQGAIGKEVDDGWGG